MNPSTHPRSRAWAVAAVAVVLAISCSKAKTYPTISARSPDGGNVNVKGTYNHCPQTYFVATPDHARVGQTIALTAAASDVDNDTLTYSWMASAGTIDDAHAVTTTFHCVTRGSMVISLTVSDSSCDSPASGEVLCQSEDAGAPDGDTSGTGGTGGAGGTGGTRGIGGQGGSITGQPETAGSTGAHGGTTGGAGSTTTSVGGASGSGGVTGSGGAGAGTSGAGTGGTACVETSPPAAIASTCAACIAANANPMTDGCCMLHDASGLQLCQIAAACMRAGGPPVGACIMGGDPTSCFCGTNLATCDQTGKANGPCVSQMSAAAARNVAAMTTDSPTAAQVLSRQGDPSYALGRAANISAIAAIFCATECGIEQ